MSDMIFEGRSERDAVAKAAAELGSESFDVEVLKKSSSLFGRSKVRIRVRPLDGIPDPMGSGTVEKKQDRETEVQLEPPAEAIIQQIREFTETLIHKMGFPGTVAYQEMDGRKVVFNIVSEEAGILIGKKGKNIDAMQLLVNSYFIRLVDDENSPAWRVILDCEGYRDRRESTIARMAQRMADEASRTGSSRLLEPLNPFERRIVHRLVADREDVASKSEGDGLYKRVRIMSTNATRKRSYQRR